jgi:hypothetical protein
MRIGWQFKVVLGGFMSRATLRLRYDGPALASHEMDVRELGSALVALGDLFHEANKTLNGDAASVRVVIRPDIEAQCVDFSIEIIQTLIEAAKGLFAGERALTAAEMIDWILRVSGVSGIGYGLLQYLKHRGTRHIKGVTEFRDADGEILYRIEYTDGSTPDVLARPVFKMVENKKILRSLERVTDPLRQEEGITELQIYVPDTPPEQRQRITKADTTSFITRPIIEVPMQAVEPEPEAEPIITTMRVYGPVYDPKAEKWRFELNGKPEYVDISATSIASDAIARGGALVNDAYRVELQVTQHVTEGGKVASDFKVIRVLDFLPAPRQGDLGSVWSPSKDDKNP